MTSDTIGNYRLLRELGSGAMGTVFEGVDMMLERPVAVKMLRPEIASQPDLIERFRSEAVTLARLNHPSIATLYAFLRDNERSAMVMEFVRGHTLEQVLAGAGRLTHALAVDVLRQTLDGLAHAHGMGVLHRDVKPANIMLTAERAVKVTDFGIARILGASRMTREGRILGTLEYIAPERVRGQEEDPRSDLYSAGVVLYELLAGRLPFVCDTDFALMQAHLQQKPPDLSQLGVDCPAALEAVVRKALAKSPDARYQTALEFRDALEAAVPVLKPTRLAEAPVAPKLPRWSLATVVLASAIAAVGVAFWKPWEARVEPVVAVATPPPQPEPAPVVPPPPQPEPVTFLTPEQPSEPVPTEAVKPVPVRTAPRVAASKKPAPVPAFVPPPELPAPAEIKTAVLAEPKPEPEAVAPPKPPRPKDLHSVRRLYVAKMQDDLDRYIKDELREQAPDLQLAVSKADADAVMTARVDKDGMAGSAVTLGMKSAYSATVSITDVDGRNLLWSGEAGDSRAVIGMVKRGGPKKVAERIVSSIRKALRH